MVADRANQLVDASGQADTGGALPAGSVTARPLCLSPPSHPVSMATLTARATHGRRIVCPRVIRPARLVLPVALGLALLTAGCGQGKITVSQDQATLHSGAKLFNERCSGCHSLDSANAYGSKPPGQIQGGERTNGPNFNQRKVKRADVLFAIRNGGFSGAIMPANVVVGANAQKIAAFLSACSGKPGQRAPACGD